MGSEGRPEPGLDDRSLGGDVAEPKESAPLLQKDGARQQGRIAWLDALVRNSPPVRLALLILFLVATGSATAALGQSVWHHVHRSSWRKIEYAKLYELQPGYTIGTFEHVLGPPLFETSAGGFDRYTFRGRDYWVETVTRHASPATEYIAVTSCSMSFDPSFSLSDGTMMVLNRTHLADIRPTRTLAEDEHSDYTLYATEEDSWAYDSVDNGNGRSFAWGFDGACPNLPAWSSYASSVLAKQLGDGPNPFSASPAAGSKALLEFRALLPVNTFAATAPGEQSSFADSGPDFRIGVSGNDARTTTSSTGTEVSAPLAGLVNWGSSSSRTRPQETLGQIRKCLMSPLYEDNQVFGLADTTALSAVPLDRVDFKRFAKRGYDLVSLGDTNALVFVTGGLDMAVGVENEIAHRDKRVYPRAAHAGAVFVWNRKPTPQQDYAATWCG